MKITICGSTAFYDRIEKKTRDKLKELGYEVERGRPSSSGTITGRLNGLTPYWS